MKRTLEGLLEYFEGLDESQINQELGYIRVAAVVRDGIKPCGCFGAHSDMFHHPEKGCNPFERWDYSKGKQANSVSLGLKPIHIVKAWERLRGDNFPSHFYHPYGDEPWPFTPVETLREIIRFRKERELEHEAEE